MKILFANPMRENEYKLNPTLGPFYIMSYLEKYAKNKHEMRYAIKDFDKVILDFKPDIVAISTGTTNFNFAKRIARTAKDNGAVTVVGGIHMTVLPKTIGKSMDIGIIGEGEQTFLEIVESIEKNGFDKEKIKKIKGIVTWDGSEVHISPRRELIKNIDDIPFPERKDIKFYQDPNIMTSRGCVYNCSFCVIGSFWKCIRFHSAEYVFEEIKSILRTKKNVKRIAISDALFAMNVPRLEKLVELIKKEGINKKISFDVSGRANIMNDKIMGLIKEMNATQVCYGFESGSPEMLKYAKGDNVTVEDNARAVALTKKYGITCKGFFIIGFPYDTKKTIYETYNFIKKHKPDLFEVYILTPFPGTRVWDYAKKKGIVSDDMNWERLENKEDVSTKGKIVLTENLTREQVENMCEKFKKLRERMIFKYRVREFLKDPTKIFSFFRFKKEGIVMVPD